MGFASLELDGYVDLFYVHKDHQREGIGYALYQSIESKARETGLRELRSDVSQTAIQFFMNHGFEALRENEVTIAGVTLSNRTMAKRLA